MAGQIVTALFFMLENKKVGEATGATYEFDGGIGQVATSDGIANTIGIGRCKIDFQTILPRAQFKNDFFTMLKSRRDVVARFQIAGKWHTSTGKLSMGRAQSSNEKGESTGDFSFLGDEPEIQG